MVFDDQQNDFLDNIIKNASNEDLIKMQQAANRQPASDVQGQNVVEVSGNADVKPIELGDDYKYKNPTTPIFLENTNRALQQRQADAAGLADNYKSSVEDLNKNKMQLGDIVNQINTIGSNRPDTSSLTDQISNAAKDINAAKAPARDPLSQAILSFAPALFGSLTGEAGQASQLPAGQQARQQYEAGRKQDIEIAGAQNQAALNRYQALVKLRDDIINQSNKRDEMTLKQKEAQINAAKLLVGTGSKDIKTTQDALNKVSEEIAKSTQSGAQEAAKMEYKPTEEANKIKQAQIRGQVSAGNQQNARDERFHNQNVMNVDKNPNIRQYVANYGNLQQAATKLNDPNVSKTPEVLQDVQRLITKSMGNTGGSGVNERSAQNAVRGLGVDATEFMSYINTNPTAVSEQTRQKMTNFFKGLLNNEQFTTQAIVGNNLGALTAGHASMYARRPDLQGDLMEKIKAYQDLMKSDVGTPPLRTPTPNFQNMTREQKIQLLKSQGHQ